MESSQTQGPLQNIQVSIQNLPQNVLEEIQRGPQQQVQLVSAQQHEGFPRIHSAEQTSDPTLAPQYSQLVIRQTSQPQLQQQQHKTGLFYSSNYYASMNSAHQQGTAQDALQRIDTLNQSHPSYVPESSTSLSKAVQYKQSQMVPRDFYPQSNMKQQVISS